MIQELERVVLTVELPEYGLKQGDMGTVMLVHRGGEAYEVEFITLDGETVGLLSLFASQVRPLGRREIANARPLEGRVAQSAALT